MPDRFYHFTPWVEKTNETHTDIAVSASRFSEGIVDKFRRLDCLKLRTTRRRHQLNTGINET